MQELTPLILAIHMEPSRLMRLAFTAAALKIRVLPVDQTSWGQPLSALCGLMPLRSTSSSVQVGEEMLVMAFLDDTQLDLLLQALRDSGLAPIRLKAVLTPVNQNWNCGQLYTALRDEANAMKAQKGAKA